ncbi:MAG: GNAT family N-acetyltransferase [Thermosynechococcaceae cyanobacterium MS004]|nr:GNAT family N-acetyltransferase [Thermosynechococcaceae cyanobacterium MS004]
MPPILRPAVPTDTVGIFSLIQELAAYEKLTHQVTGTAEALGKHLFEEPTQAEAIVAEIEGHLIGFALFFKTYSTFLTQPGLHLEDIYVQEPYRGQGIGTALLQTVAQIAVERRYGRLEWTVLDWNTPAIAFYQKMGAEVLPDWKICRVTEQSLLKLGKVNGKR